MIDLTKKFLFVFAHPDDESFYTGGTIAHITDAGGEAHIVSLTAGEHGIKHIPKELIGNDITELRRLEFSQAAKTLGARSAQILHYPDGGIHRSKTDSIAETIANVITEHTPDYIVTFGEEPHYPHLDHLATREATRKAWEYVRSNSAFGLLEVVLPNENAEALAEMRQQRLKTREHYLHTYEAKMFPVADLIEVQLSPLAIERKHRALMAHASQEPQVFVEHLLKLPLPNEYYVYNQ